MLGQFEAFGGNVDYGAALHPENVIDRVAARLVRAISDFYLGEKPVLLLIALANALEGPSEPIGKDRFA